MLQGYMRTLRKTTSTQVPVYEMWYVVVFSRSGWRQGYVIYVIYTTSCCRCETLLRTLPMHVCVYVCKCARR